MTIGGFFFGIMPLVGDPLRTNQEAATMDDPQNTPRAARLAAAQAYTDALQKQMQLKEQFDLIKAFPVPASVQVITKAGSVVGVADLMAAVTELVNMRLLDLMEEACARADIRVGEARGNLARVEAQFFADKTAGSITVSQELRQALWRPVPEDCGRTGGPGVGPGAPGTEPPMTGDNTGYAWGL